MSQVEKKFLADDAVDGTKVKLANNQALKARNSADSADLDLLKANASDQAVVGGDFIPDGQITRDNGIAAKIWRKGFFRTLRYSLDLPIIDLEFFLLKDVNGNDAFDWSGANDVIIHKNILPFSGSTNTLGKSGGPAWGHVWTTKIGNGSVEFGIPTVAGTAGQVFTNLGGGATAWQDNGSGDVVGPVSSQDNDLPVFDGATGKLLKVSGANLSVSSNVTSLFFYSFQNQGQDLEVNTQDAAAASNADGGHINLKSGNGDGTGAGGDWIATAGNAVSNDGGNINIRGGNSTNNGGGGINLLPGKGGDHNGAVHFKDNQVDHNDMALMKGDGFTLNGTRAIKFNGGNVTLQGSSTYVSPVDFFLPNSFGTNGYLIKTDGSGNLDWVAPVLNKKELFTLSAGDITNGYIDLAFEAKVDSIDFVVSGLVSREAVDYTINYTGGGGGVTRIDFSGHTPVLIAGNEVRIKYQH